MTNMNGKESERITKLEVGQQHIKDDLSEVKIDVKKMLTNHLPHIEAAVKETKTDLEKKITKNSNDVKVLAIKLSFIIFVKLVIPCSNKIYKF